MPNKFCGKCGDLVLEGKTCDNCRPIKQQNKTKSVNMSASFKKLRPKILARDNHTCQMCKALNKVWYGSQINLEVHHIKPQNKYNGTNGYPDLRREPSNLVTLCSRCHDEIKQDAEELPFPFNPKPLDVFI